MSLKKLQIVTFKMLATKYEEKFCKEKDRADFNADE